MIAIKPHWMLTQENPMAEPTRKQKKAHGNSNVLPFPQVTDETSLVFITTHKTQPYLVDLTVFRDGNNASLGNNPENWAGSFSGRPLLIAQLLPHIRSIYSGQGQYSLRNLIGDLRTYWRLFDACDALPIDQRPKSVEGVADLTDLHDRLQVRNRINGDQTRTFVRLANAARKQLGLAQLDWKPNDTRSNKKIRVALELAQTRALYHAVKNHVRTIYTRWDNDTTLVPSKRDCLYILIFLLIKTGWNEAVALSIDCQDYVRPHVGDPDRHVLHAIKARARGTEQVHVGRNQEEWSPGNLVKKLIQRSEPLREQLRNQLVELQEQTKSQRTTDAQILQIAKLKRKIQSVWLHVAKRGARAVEDFDPKDPTWNITALTAGDVKATPFPGGKYLIKFLQGQANCLLSTSLRTNQSDASGKVSAASSHNITVNTVAAGAPTINVVAGNDVIHAAGPGSVISGINELGATVVLSMGAITRTATTNGEIWSYTLTAVDIAELGPAHPLIENITISDIRDAYINWAYSSTGYEWMMAKLAAGHTSIQSAVTYLRTRALKQHGEAAVRQLTTIVFDEIKTQRRLDPIFLYARVNRGAVSDQQRERWTQGKDRTRVGTGCADFKHPPKHMAPHHQEGKGCRTQRCTLCEHAVVFEDSYPHLARRKAELLSYEKNLGLMVWATTDFPDELRKVEQTLNSYDPASVSQSLAHWQEEINAGRHTPPIFEGTYE